MKIKKEHTILKILSILLITFLIMLSMPKNVSLAKINPAEYNKWNNENGKISEGGMIKKEDKLKLHKKSYFPVLVQGTIDQYLDQRRFTGIPSLKRPYENWKVEIPKMDVWVYCAKIDTPLFMGKFDSAEYPVGDANLAGMNTYIENTWGKITKQPEKVNDYYEPVHLDTKKEKGLRYFLVKGKVDKNGQFIFASPETDKENNIPTMVQQIFDEVINGKLVWGSMGETNPNAEIKDVKNGVKVMEKPSMLVAEKVTKVENGKEETELKYKLKDNYTHDQAYGYEKDGNSITDNKELGYIMTAMENSYDSQLLEQPAKQENLHLTYSPIDIQGAIWNLENPELTKEDTKHTYTENSEKLNKNAKLYTDMKETNYENRVNIEPKKMQVKNYNDFIEIGPIVLKYPEFSDISYVKSIYIKDAETGEILAETDLFDKTKSTLKIITEGNGDKTESSNGINATFPKNNQKFFIKVSKKQIENVNSIKVGADFEYLKNAEVTYNNLKAMCNRYQYITYDNDIIGEPNTFRLSHLETEKSKDLYLIQPYIKMKPTPFKTEEGQPLKIPISGSRTYDVCEKESDEIIIGLELAGNVWVDEKNGKETGYNGIFDKNDTKMKNVKVSLYEVGNDARPVRVTTTDENGKYSFKGLPLNNKQYYVKFTYNGQYYQPTIYQSEKKGATKQNRSKGLDKLDERDKFNLKFSDIGPNGSTGNSNWKVERRDKLYKDNLIDEYGNIPIELDSNGNRQSSNQYVNESMMNSYTCAGGEILETYPKYNSNGALDKDENLNINQGYILRELFDLGLRKDVDKVDLEINGKNETYKYNKREHLETDKNGNSYWEISTRISDGYYNQEYTREIYREDYDYKIDNYKMDGQKTTLENLGLTEDSELKIFVTYKITIRNRSENIAAKVTEVVDYYDKDFTFVPDLDKSYIGDSDGNKVGDISTSNHSIYGKERETTVSGYKNLYITGVNGESLPLSDTDDNTKDVYLYLTFIVNKDEYRNNIVDENIKKPGELLGVGKENIAEINGYKTYYGKKVEAPNKGNPKTKEEYVPGDIAGISDYNSTPGNLNPNDVPKDGKIKNENFENDTDKAPNIKIIFNKKPRTVQGTVWEDLRNKQAGLAQIGNGLRENETGINGVRVQLVELREGEKDNKKVLYEYIWKEVYSGNKDKIDPIVNNSGTIPQYQIDTDNADGKYKFEGFIPGNYVVRFIYGSDESSVIGSKKIDYNSGNEQENPVAKLYSDKGYKIRTDDKGYSAENSEKIGLNKKSYNGHDYKSTLYQVGIDNGEGAYNNNSTASYDYNFAEADKGLYSDAKDIMNQKSNNVINIAPKKEYLEKCSNSRTEVEEYFKEPQKNKEAEILAAFENLPEYKYEKYDFETMKKLVDEFMNKTFMIAESGKINVNFEFNIDKPGDYVLDNLDLGLEERPKAQLKTTKQITNVKVTLADNRVLFDASGRATNVLWIAHEAHGQDTENTYEKENNYNTKTNLMKTPIVRQSATNKGKIQLTMDEELMHGSTIQITYAITVANVGEVDYKENQFYYTGTVGNTGNIVKTNPMKLVDYVGTQVQEYGVADDVTATRNNLEFMKDKNPDWEVISADELIGQGYINSNLENNVKKYGKNHIVKTDKISKDLIPIIADQEKAKVIKDKFKNDPMHALETVNQSNSVSGVQLILSKVITQDSKDDDRIYNNMTELVEVKNDVGRRMNYSIVGNQDPTIEPYEIDADDSEEVVILPPFGQKYIYYVLGSVVALILIAGIAMTIMILKKKK